MMHKPGDVIGGRYRVDRILGRGGMGGVYLVTQLALEKPFALKEMLVDIPDPGRREAAINQFKVEAQILHTLQHAGLPRLYDFFEEGRTHYYLAMEYINGGTLDDYLQTNTVTESEALQWTQELCSVLHYLHTHNPPVIFRDLKPSNIMLTPNGHIKMIDFGIAKVWDTQKDVNITRTAIRGAGSPGFAAPEQYGGGTDERTDIYALGATIYSLLSRTMPPQSVDMASGRHQLPNLREVRPDISERTIANIEWMMKLNLTERPQTVVEIMEAFGWGSPRAGTPPTRAPYWMGSALTQLPSAAGAAASQTTMKRSRSRPWGMIAATGVLALLLGWLGWRAVHGHKLRATPLPTPPVVEAGEVKVSINVKPHDAQLFINQLFKPLIGPSPSIHLSPGAYTLSFERPGYLEYDTTIVVQPGASPTVVVASMSPAMASIHIDTTPPGAFIKMDDEDLGKSPVASHPVGAGTHVIFADQPGFKPMTTPVKLLPGDDRSVSLILTPASPILQSPGPIPTTVDTPPSPSPSPGLLDSPTPATSPGPVSHTPLFGP